MLTILRSAKFVLLFIQRIDPLCGIFAQEKIGLVLNGKQYTQFQKIYWGKQFILFQK